MLLRVMCPRFLQITGARAALCASLSGIAPVASADEDSNRQLHQLRAGFRLDHSGSDESIWLKKARGLISMGTMEGIEPLLGRVKTVAGTSAEEAVTPTTMGAFGDPFACVVNPARAGLQSLEDGYGLRTDIYEAVVFQTASDAIAGMPRSAGAARFNYQGELLLFRNEGEGMGRFTAQFRQNNAFQTSELDLSTSVDSPTALDSLASGTDTFLVRCYYAQTFLDDRVLIAVGKLVPGDYIALNLFASDETTQVLAGQFDGTDSLPIAYDFATEGVAVQAILTDWLYVDAMFVCADGVNEPWLNFNFDEGIMVAAEAGILFEWRAKPGRVSFAWAGSNATAATINDDAPRDQWGNSYAFTAQYFATDDVGVWFQWSWADAFIANASPNQGGLGVTVEDCFGRKGDGFGIAAGWSVPLDESLSTQGLVESYYRMQMTTSLQVSLDVQLLVPPATDAIDDPTIVGSIRAVLRF